MYTRGTAITLASRSVESWHVMGCDAVLFAFKLPRVDLLRCVNV